jgi:hypothetical protein
MRREFVAMESALREFVEQPDYPTLIIDCTDNDVVFPINVFQNWERQWDGPVFLNFPFECNDVAHYVQQCMNRLVAEIDIGNEERRSRGETPWPPLPLLCSDIRQLPSIRLYAAIEHVRGLVPEGIDIVWGLLPGALGDPVGYKTMIAPLLALDGFEDWLEGHRFLLRDNRAAPFLLPDLAGEEADHVLTLRVDFSTARVADTLVKAVNDPNFPLPERMQALSQLAAFDYAYQRYDQALEKYALLHSYHMQQGDAVGQALALTGAGDVVARRGGLQEAKTRYQQALAVAGPTHNLAVMLNPLMAVGDCCLSLQQYDEAEGYLALANQCAGRLISPYAKIEAMEKLGVAQLAQHNAAEAAETWRTAKDLCRQFGFVERGRAILDRLITLYAQAGRRQQAKEYEREQEQFGQEPPALASDPRRHYGHA